ncbi:MAG: hypothetical protein ACR2IQ_02555 [Minisyncoccia bacterium]
MTVSRKSPGDYKDNYQAEEDFEMTETDYLADKRACQDRSGYAPISDEQLEQKAVDEKLPMGSQSY